MKEQYTKNQQLLKLNNASGCNNLVLKRKFSIDLD